MEINKVHCFFEQSGVFKNEFNKLGIQAFDYDILNEFEQTDFIIDLFEQIELAYKSLPSIFDIINEDDLIIAFFPCVRFTFRMQFNFKKMSNYSYKYNDIEKLEKNIRYFDEMNYLYSLISKLVIVCLKNNFRLIIENPYHERHILTQFWHISPKIIDTDRTRRGDNFKKPTQYWFINCEPNNIMLNLPIVYSEYKTIDTTINKIERSLINPNYTERFIKEFII